MKLLREFVRQYPGQSLVLVLALLVAGIADGIGLSALLPLLNLALDPSAAMGASTTDAASLDRVVLDGVQALGLTPTIGVLLVVICVGIAVKSLLLFLAEQRIGYIAADVMTELRVRLLKAITESRWRYFVDQSTGKLANSLATEAWRASDAYVFGVKLLALAIEVVVYVGLALLVSWQATVVCLAAAALIFVISNRFVEISRKAGAGQTRWYRSLLTTLTDILQSVKTFKAMGRHRIAEEVMAHEADRLKHTLKREVLGKAALISAQEPMFMVVLAVGVYLAVVQFSIEMATVLFLVLVLSRLLRRTGKLQRMYQQMTTRETAYWAVQESIAEAQTAAEVSCGTLEPKLTRNVRLADVSIAYGEHVVLDSVSFCMNVGEITCLVGESGAGKSTIGDLVIGLIEPDSGQVLIDDRPLAEYDLGSWRKQIGYVPQENLLLHDSVLHNVTLGGVDVAEEQVVAALKAAGAWDFVSRMPGGIHATVGERGTRLSGGQRQRVILARAIVHWPKLLILDEATSALDGATEAEILATLEALKGSMSVLIVSHKLSATAIADHVYTIGGGAIEPWSPPDDAARVSLLQRP